MLVITLLPTVTALQRQPITVSITAERASVYLGDSVLLSWRATGVDSIYIAYLGTVAATGSRRISPQRTAMYTAVAERNGRTRTASTRIAVAGTRGGADFPERNDLFSFPLRATNTSRTLPALLARIEDILQDEYYLSVDPYAPSGNGQFVFITTKGFRRDLLDPNNRIIEGRRLAFRIIVETGNVKGGIRYTIATLLERKKRLVTPWKREENAAIAGKEARKLRDRINALK